MTDTLVLAGAALTMAGAAGVLLGRAEARRRTAMVDLLGSRREAERMREVAAAEGQRLVREAELAARESALARRREAEAALRRTAGEVAGRQTALAAQELRLE